MKKYIPITEQPYCCVPACIQMILLRRSMPLKSQEEIEYDLGLIVPQKYKKLFGKVRTGKRPKAGWGTQTGKLIYSLNNFFRKNRINIKEERSFLIKPKEIKGFLKKNLKDKDIIVCFDYENLYHKQRDSRGHVSIIENMEDDIITLIDPKYGVPKYRKVYLDEISKTIKSQGEGEGGGFWVIS